MGAGNVFGCIKMTTRQIKRWLEEDLSKAAEMRRYKPLLGVSLESPIMSSMLGFDNYGAVFSREGLERLVKRLNVDQDYFFQGNKP